MKARRGSGVCALVASEYVPTTAKGRDGRQFEAEYSYMSVSPAVT
jgi:hypothetical protein